MVLNTDWAQVEVIDLINDGSGLAFGIIGGRSTGVVVKTIVPGGVADRDGRLQSGDHILQIGEVNLRGLGSEQVASVLRQCGVHVRMVVARPVESTSADYQSLGSHAPIVPTKILGDPVELDKHLNDNGYGDVYAQNPSNSSYAAPYIYTGQHTDVQLHSISGLVDVVRNPLPIGSLPFVPTAQAPAPPTMLPLDMALREPSLPETETFGIDLLKDELGLGITVAGYVCEKEEISGIFVKSISKGSAADLSGKIKINDRIIMVNGESVVGFTNHQAVEVLRKAGAKISIEFERYLRGPKYEQLQQAILANELRPTSPSSPTASSLPKIPLSLVHMSSLGIEPEGESRTSFDFDSAVLLELDTPTNDAKEIVIDTAEGRRSVQFSICSHESIHEKWRDKLRDDVEIVIAEMIKEASSGLGISLEGTVDVEDGKEVRPHHYIRNILPNGPVGKNAILQSGDELLEVNGIQLLGLNHLEVVSILKQLPSLVILVCARYSVPTRIIDTAQHRDAFQARNILAESISALIQTSERLVKAKSDSSISSSVASETCCSMGSRSKSLEIVAGLPMWSDERTVVVLTKGDYGLGFSILDYQDPLNPQETVIVIRSLVPGGVAQQDGRLIPGDRLLAVNDINVEHASLDRAVQILKGAPKGSVKITVAKPLSSNDTISQHSQDTEDDQTCIDDFQECIEEYQECLEVVQICIEEDRSFNHSPCISQVEDLGVNNNNNKEQKNQQKTEDFGREGSKNEAVTRKNGAEKYKITVEEDVSSEPELSFKSLCETNSARTDHRIFGLLTKNDSLQRAEDSEKDGYETCQDESFSEDPKIDEKTPTNSVYNLQTSCRSEMYVELEGQGQKEAISIDARSHTKKELDNHTKRDLSIDSKKDLGLESHSNKVFGSQGSKEDMDGDFDSHSKKDQVIFSKNLDSLYKKDVSSKDLDSHPNKYLSGHGKNLSSLNETYLDSNSKKDLISYSKNDLNVNSRNDLYKYSNNDLSAHRKRDLGSPSNKDLSGHSKQDLNSHSNKNLSGQSKRDFDSQSNKDLSGHNKRDFDSQSNKDLSGQSKRDLGSQSNKDPSGQSKEDLDSQSNKDLSGYSKKDLDSESNKNLSGHNKRDLDSQSHKDLSAQSKSQKELYTHKTLEHYDNMTANKKPLHSNSETGSQVYANLTANKYKLLSKPENEKQLYVNLDPYKRKEEILSEEEIYVDDDPSSDTAIIPEAIELNKQILEKEMAEINHELRKISKKKEILQKKVKRKTESSDEVFESSAIAEETKRKQSLETSKVLDQSEAVFEKRLSVFDESGTLDPSGIYLERSKVSDKAEVLGQSRFFSEGSTVLNKPAVLGQQGIPIERSPVLNQPAVLGQSVEKSLVIDNSGVLATSGVYLEGPRGLDKARILDPTVISAVFDKSRSSLKILDKPGSFESSEILDTPAETSKSVDKSGIFGERPNAFVPPPYDDPAKSSNISTKPFESFTIMNSSRSPFETVRPPGAPIKILEGAGQSFDAMRPPEAPIKTSEGAGRSFETVRLPGAPIKILEDAGQSFEIVRPPGAPIKISEGAGQSLEATNSSVETCRVSNFSRSVSERTRPPAAPLKTSEDLEVSRYSHQARKSLDANAWEISVDTYQPRSVCKPKPPGSSPQVQTSRYFDPPFETSKILVERVMVHKPNLKQPLAEAEAEILPLTEKNLKSLNSEEKLQVRAIDEKSEDERTLKMSSSIQDLSNSEPCLMNYELNHKRLCLDSNHIYNHNHIYLDSNPDDLLNSYENSMREDEFFLVQFPDELAEKSHSEPNVLERLNKPTTYRYRIAEYYNDIEDCLQSFREAQTLKVFSREMSDDEIFNEIPLPVKSRSAPDVLDNSFVTLTYDPGPGNSIRRKSFVPGYNIQNDNVPMTVCSNSNTMKNIDVSNMLEKHWGATRVVTLDRDPNQSLGISIVGGKVDLYHETSSETILGIFIKNVVPDSPAGRCGELKTGDRILEVSGFSLKNISHEKAVGAIKYAKNPVTLVVQSLIPYSNNEATEFANEVNCASPGSPHPSPAKTASPEEATVQQPKKSLPTQKSVEFSEVVTVNNIDAPPQRQKTVESSEESDDEEDVRDLEGRTVSAKGQEIDRASAANLKRTKEEAAMDPEEEDDFGYTMNKVKKKYTNLGHTVLMVQLERSVGQGLGLSLAGHKDRNCMAVFVCGINPAGAAHRAGGIQVGDEILEVNGVVLHGRCHLNASAIIKGLSGPIFKLIILRRKAAIDDIAVRPITQFPVSLAEEASEESFSNYPNVRTISIKKGSQSLGIMIIEGKHAEVGQGIFISDIQEGSSAEKAGLEIGEMILAVNKDSLLGSNYDTAANLLKRTEGLVTLVVSNPGKKATTPTPDDKNSSNKTLKAAPAASRPTTPIPEPPADPTTCPIAPGRDTTIEIISDNKTLGLCFVGGKDTAIVGGIIVVEVYSGGAAEKDGRLQPGDQILDVNGTSLKDVTHNAASQALRQTLPKMKLIVFRSEKPDYQVIDTEFTKKPGKGMGLSVVAKKSGKGVYVSEILNGGCADVDGKIMRGDLIVSVNGQSVDGSSGEEAGAVLKTITGKVSLKLHRYKPATR